MATSFPNQIQRFKEFLDINNTDGPMIAEYQRQVETGNITEANRVLQQIPKYNQKIITADDLNAIVDTTEALENYYLQKYSPTYVVSRTRPTNQNPSDFWLKIIR